MLAAVAPAQYWLGPLVALGCAAIAIVVVAWCIRDGGRISAEAEAEEAEK